MSQINQKIEWYQELLAVEPSSRVFFPLAKLLMQESRKAEALEVLKKGLVFHPEYIEAKLFLIELEQENLESDQLYSQVNELAGIFTSYPKFWSQWSEQEVNNLDLSCALGLVSLILKKDSLNIRNVLLAGIESINNNHTPDAQEAKQTSVKIEAVKIIDQAAKEEAKEEVKPSQGIEQPKIFQMTFKASNTAKTASQSVIPNAEESLKCSTYTRSMAELLVEQGDIGGALNILEKLLTIKEEEQDYLAITDIKKRIETLSSYHSINQNYLPEEEIEPEEEFTEKAKTKTNKTLAFLSSLASRLEARGINANL